MSALLEARGLTKNFVRAPDLIERLLGGRRSQVVRAVDHVDLTIAAGEVVGLVGESGCGKSTLGRMVCGILPASEGQMFYRGRNTEELDRDARHRMKLEVQMIFQNPMASLNPRLRVRDIVGEAPRVHGLISRRELDGYVATLLEQVGLDASYAERYPHQFSGGQRQRIGIARALAVQPRLIVCDESVAALDVSIQAQVLNLFMDLRQRLGLTYLFISHDLGVVEHLSDRVAIMYLGSIVETGTAGDIFARPNHPYTRGLLAEVPRIDIKRRRYLPIQGEIPSPLAPPHGCHFHPRCPQAMPRCAQEVPQLAEIAGGGHLSACHLNENQ